MFGLVFQQEIKEDEQYKEEQEITHEADPEKERYLPGEKLLKKINKANKKMKKEKEKKLEYKILLKYLMLKQQ